MNQTGTSSTLLQGILDTSPGAIMVYQVVSQSEGQAVDLQLTMLNEQAAQMIGVSAELAIGLSPNRLFLENIQNEWYEQLLSVTQTGRTFAQDELYMPLPNGSSSWYSVSARQFEDYVIITYTDITARKRTDLQKEEQRELLENVFASSLLGIVLFDIVRDAYGAITDFRLRRINDAGLRISKRTRDEVVGKTVKELYPPTIERGFFNEYLAVCQNGTALEVERYYPELDAWYNITAKAIDAGLLLTYQDITGHKKAQHEAERQAGLLTRISESMRVAVSVQEAVRNETGQIVDFRYSYFNEQARVWLPMTNWQEVIGQTIRTMAFTSAVEQHIARLIRVVETGEPDHFDAVTHNGRVFHTMIARLGDGTVSTIMDVTELRQHERHLEEQADFLKNIFNNPFTGTVVYDAVTEPSGVIVGFRYRLLNETAQQLIGIPLSQLEGRLTSEIDVIGNTPDLMARMVSVFQTGKSLRFELYRDDIDAWRDIAMARLNNGIVLKFNDITSRKRAERDRLQQANLLQTVIDNAPVGIILAEAIYQDGQIVDFRYQLTNRLNAGTMGYTVEGMTGRAISELFPAWQAMRLFRDMQGVVETGQQLQYTDEYDNYGNKAWYEYYISKQDNGVLLTFLDVTLLKEAELKQQEQANLLQTVIDNSPTGIVLYRAVRDGTGQIIDFTHELSNPANDAVTGRAAGELIGLSMLEHFPSNRENGHFNDLIQVVETGQSLRQLLDYRAHGISGWFDAQYVKQGDGVLFTYLDVTESQQYRRQVEAANIELHRSNDNLLQFAYVASHDLQEPLRKIQQFGDLLIGEYYHVLAGNGQDYLRRMHASASRMSLLIKDLLAYSRLTTHREAFRPVKLNTIVAEVLDDLEVSITESKAVVTVDSLPTLPGDELQLRQLFQNLIGNALKFTQLNSSGKAVAPVISISSRRLSSASLPDKLLAQTQLGINGTAGSWFHEISVVDNGIGFDEKYLDRIFQVFQRLHSKNEFAGSGVGLAICRKVVENHSGAITASSKPGTGTTFKIYLPE